VLVAVFSAVLLGAIATDAHIIYRQKTLLDLVRDADLVVYAQIAAREPVAARSSESPGLERPEVTAKVIEVLKGSHDPGPLRFVQHGHGVATFEPGGDHLLFLVHIARSRELDELGKERGHRWVSLQEHDDAYPVKPDSSVSILAATREYSAGQSAPEPQLRVDHLRAGTLVLLSSGDTKLAESAIRDLVGSPAAPFILPEDRPALEGVLDNPKTDIGVRVALLMQAEARNILDGRDRWLALLAPDNAPSDLVVAIRAAANDRRATIHARVLALLDDERIQVAAAAANALGRPGDARAVEPLTQALDHPSSRVRHAAIRGLGKTRTPEALGALEKAGETHPDPTTRRLARAEARKREAQATP
jgi:hypothetical protein